MINQNQADSRRIKVFVSYRRSAKQIVEQIIEALKAEGFDVWYDGLIKIGEVWWKTILKNIEDSDIVIPILSRDFHQSIYCDREVSYANQCDRRIYPIRIDTDYNGDYLSEDLEKIISDLQSRSWPEEKQSIIKELHEAEPSGSLPEDRNTPSKPISFEVIQFYIKWSNKISENYQKHSLRTLKEFLTSSPQREKFNIEIEQIADVLRTFLDRNDIVKTNIQEAETLLSQAEEQNAKKRPRNIIKILRDPAVQTVLGILGVVIAIITLIITSDARSDHEPTPIPVSHIPTNISTPTNTLTHTTTSTAPSTPTHTPTVTFTSTQTNTPTLTVSPPTLALTNILTIPTPRLERVTNVLNGELIPVFRVIVDNQQNSFLIDERVVTFGAYAQCLECTPPDPDERPPNATSDDPVVGITAPMAQEYCRRINQRGRLPSKDEWQHASQLIDSLGVSVSEWTSTILDHDGTRYAELGYSQTLPERQQIPRWPVSSSFEYIGFRCLYDHSGN